MTVNVLHSSFYKILLVLEKEKEDILVLSKTMAEHYWKMFLKYLIVKSCQ